MPSTVPGGVATLGCRATGLPGYRATGLPGYPRPAARGPRPGSYVPYQAKSRTPHTSFAHSRASM